jgi:hypothetical protein
MKLGSKTIPVLMTLVLLAGVTLEAFVRPRPLDAEPFHRRIREAAVKVPTAFGDWESEEVPVPPAAVALLRPNVIFQRRYTNRRTGRLAEFLLVQCGDARDMAGHYPPICYPAHGWDTLPPRSGEWDVSGRKFAGVEYHFTKIDDGQVVSRFVRNLMILPDGTLVREMDRIRAVASNRLRQFYGAAQIQIVIDAAVPAAERDEIFAELLNPHLSLVDALGSGGRS